MNNSFDIKRFGNYLLYDLRRAQSNYLISGLILGCMPLIVFFLVQFFSFLLTGELVKNFANAYIPMAVVVVLFTLIFTFPTKMYGQLTDKRFGSDWLMIPASTLEKWLSMVLMVCVIAPLSIVLVGLAVDGLMSLCIGEYYGHSVLGNIHTVKQVIAEETNGALRINLGAIGFAGISESMFVFTLGALCFKKSKAAKTFLTLMLLQMAFTSFLGAISFSGWFDSNWFDFVMRLQEEPNDITRLSHLMKMFNIFLNIWYPIVFAALGGAIYYRIKTLKH